MSRRNNAAPVIIRRKKVVAGSGHHGGAWKVAYADFVTAMMAFFLLMWLLSATTESQRRGLADYFSTTIPVNRISGGGAGAFSGDSMFAEDTQAQSGSGGTGELERQVGAGGEQAGPDVETALLETLTEELQGRGGESMQMRQDLRHIITRVTDEGLVVELFDLPGAPLFHAEEATPMPVLLRQIAVLAEVFDLVENGIAIEAHSRSYPLVMIDNPVWGLSAARAQQTRLLLEQAGLDGTRLRRVTGHADRRPAVQNPMAERNNRLEVILLRSDL